MGAERVEFKTDQLNVQARQGLRNIGATEEGTLRSFNPMPDGTAPRRGLLQRAARRVAVAACATVDPAQGDTGGGAT